MLSKLSPGFFALLLCTIGCSSNDHPEAIDNGPYRPSPSGDGGSSPNGVATGSAGEDGDGSVPDGSGAPTGGMFDPDRVYVGGLLVDYDGYGAALVSAPEHNLSYKLDDSWLGMLWGTKFVYRSGNRFMEFVPDKPTATSPGNNDVVAFEPDCGDDDVGHFYYNTPSGRFLYTCGEDVRTYYENGKVVYDGSAGIILRIVNDDLALLGSGVDFHGYGMLRLSTGEASPLPPELKDLSQGLFHSSSNGCHAVVFSPDFTESALWEFNADGSAKKLGDYPPLPGLNQVNARTLGADDVYYASWWDGSEGSNDSLLKLSPGAAEPEVIYKSSKASKLVFRRGLVSLFTGP